MKIDFCTFCCPKDIHKLHDSDMLENIVNSHQTLFNNILVIHQRCQGIEYKPFNIPTRILESENYPTILEDFNIEPDNSHADELTHGPTGPHYWKWHVINHLIGLKESDSDYIVFSDCDCSIVESAEQSWVAKGIDLLKQYPNILIVSPGDGGYIAEDSIGDVRLTKNVSQQIFLCRTNQFKNSVNFDLAWNKKLDAVGGPFQEYYYMLEGRIWRYLRAQDMWRAVLPDVWRYWHYQW